MMWQKTFLAKSQTKELTIIFHDMDLGGVQRKITDLINYFQKKYPGIRITLYLRYKRGIFLEKIPKNVEIKYPRFHTPKMDMICFTFWLIGRLIKDKPKTILAFMDMVSVPILMAKKIVFWIDTKVVVGEDILTSEHVKEETMPKVRLWLIKKLYKKADKILVQTEIQKNDLINILGKENQKKIAASPNWLPLDFPPKKKENKKREIDVLFLGRVEPQKNPAKFVEIIKLLLKNNANIKAKIIGSGSLVEKTKKMVKSLGLEKNISFLPTTKNPAEYYSKSKVFLMTSDYEGFPLTLMEAISCGCRPVVNSMKETNLFFDKYKKEIIFRSTEEAKEKIEKIDKEEKELIKYYKEKVLAEQKNNIEKYAGYVLE